MLILHCVRLMASSCHIKSWLSFFSDYTAQILIKNWSMIQPRKNNFWAELQQSSDIGMPIWNFAAAAFLCALFSETKKANYKLCKMSLSTSNILKKSNFCQYMCLIKIEITEFILRIALFLAKFRESNFLIVSEITKELIWRNILSNEEE